VSWNELLLDLESYMERYRRALDEIANNEWCNSQESLDKIQEIAQATLDGEPTTADKHNKLKLTLTEAEYEAESEKYNKWAQNFIKKYPNDMELGNKLRTLINIGDDIEYKWVSPNDPGDEHDTSK